MRKTIETLIHEQKHLKEDQYKMFDDYLMETMLNDNVEENEKAYEEYIDKLNGFDVRGFENVIKSLLKEPKGVQKKYFDEFYHIPNYIHRRNNWDERIQIIIESEDSPQNKQSTIDDLNRRRSIHHDGIIDLFNNLNQYASEKEISPPYPSKYGVFDKNIKEHREFVAAILSHHTSLLMMYQQIKP